MELTTAAKEMHDLQAQLAAHIETAKAEEARLRREITARKQVLEYSANGIDQSKLALAKAVIFVRGSYAKAGDDRASVISDAIKQFATGAPLRPTYGDLWHVAFGTKHYSGWYGQRSDHEYGYGPRHGSIIFQVGVVEDVRKRRAQTDLTPEEVEAAIYYLTNIERIQSAESAAQAA